jgi:phosphoglycerol transferase
MQFPESPPIHRMEDYSHLKGYLHSKWLKWSYAAVKGRPGHNEIHAIADQALQIEQVLRMGYSGIYIDRFAFPDHAASLERLFEQKLSQRPLVSPDGRLSYFDLRLPIPNSQ